MSAKTERDFLFRILFKSGEWSVSHLFRFVERIAVFFVCRRKGIFVVGIAGFLFLRFVIFKKIGIFVIGSRESLIAVNDFFAVFVVKAAVKVSSSSVGMIVGGLTAFRLRELKRESSNAVSERVTIPSTSLLKRPHAAKAFEAIVPVRPTVND